MSQVEDSSEIAYIGLGSNLGESADMIHRAIERLQLLSDGPLLRSSLTKTVPVDCPAGSPRFVNAVVGLRPRVGETPQSLLRSLRQLEIECGRKPKKILNEPRVLDLDLIAFGSRIVNSAELVLPHPRAHLRRFVLEPLNQIAPDLILPGQNKNVRELLLSLPLAE